MKIQIIGFILAVVAAVVFGAYTAVGTVWGFLALFKFTTYSSLDAMGFWLYGMSACWACFTCSFMAISLDFSFQQHGIARAYKAKTMVADYNYGVVPYLIKWWKQR